MVLDVTSEAQWLRIMQEIDREFGRLDALVNNAGIGYFRSIVETTFEEWRKILSVNLDSVFLGTKYALPLLARVTWFARSVGIPYVPVTPTFPWLGPLGLVPFPSKWRIEFGAPLDLAAEYGPEAADDRLLVGRLSEQVRAQVQSMVDALRGHRAA